MTYLVALLLLAAPELTVTTPDGDCVAPLDAGVFHVFDGTGDLNVTTTEALTCGEPDPEPTDCSTVTIPDGYTVFESPILNFTRNNQPGSGRTFEQVFGAWPVGPEFSGATYVFPLIAKEQIISIPLVVPDDGVSVGAWLNWTGFAEPRANTRVTISECPGAILEPDVLPGCIGQGGAGSGDFTFGSADFQSACQLDPGVYWFNLSHIDRDSLIGCPSVCEWRVQPTRLQIP